MEVPGKPLGSVHGDSIGVHACDSANAWRNMARVGNPRNCFASLVLGAYQVAYDRIDRGGDFLHWSPLPLEEHLHRVTTTDPDGLLREADEAIRGNLQARASDRPAKPRSTRARAAAGVRFAPSLCRQRRRRAPRREIPAPHGLEEFASTRPAYRWRHLVALARVTASEFGRPAAGVADARELLKS